MISGFTIALIGRPNVGKSTLFNRLVGRRLALVDDSPGVTRDRRWADGSIADLKFRVIDTAGLEDTLKNSFQARIQEHTKLAIEESDLCLFIIDARIGITPFDKAFAATLRKSGKSVVLVANKCESRFSKSGYYDAFSLGFGNPCAISAEHGEGFGELYTEIVSIMGQNIDFTDARNISNREDIEKNTEKPLRIAVVGRPNAGKSTLINRMLNDNRLLTGPEIGITRDSIAVEWRWRGKNVLLFDTAGMRRKAKIHEKIEKLAVSDGLHAVRFAEVVIVLFDATIAFEKQDLQISNLIIREGRIPLIAINKWDLVKEPGFFLRKLIKKSEKLLSQVKGIKVIPVSGKTGQGIDEMMQTVFESYRVWNERITTASLNKWLYSMQANHPPPIASGRRVRLKYITQVKSRPPTFMISCSRPEALPQCYSRYLVNGLYKSFNLYGSPLRLHLRKGFNPYGKFQRRSD